MRGSCLQLLVPMFLILNISSLSDPLHDNASLHSYFPSKSAIGKGMQGRGDAVLTQWVLDERLPFNFVENPGFQRFTRTMNLLQDTAS